MMGFWGQLFFGKRENLAIIVSLPRKHIAGMETLCHLYNEEHIGIDHIDFDDIVEAGVEMVLRKCLKIREEPEQEEEPQEKPRKRRNATPVYYLDETYQPRGRSQLR